MQDSDIYNLYKQYKTERQKYEAQWQVISRYVGIKVDSDLLWKKGGQVPDVRDEYIDDPTAAISVMQSADYLAGIMWGNGDKAVRVKPSRYVLKKLGGDSALVNEYYSYVTDQLLYHVNHANAGFSRVFGAYMYDQQAFGTSGYGAYPNPGFKEGVEDNAIVFKGYGVDTLSIGEGRNGSVDYIFNTFNWRVSEIVGEFATKEGVWSDDDFNALPSVIKECWNKGKYSDVFTLVHGIIPNREFNPKMVGKKGTRYKGVWFLEDESNSGVFYEEHYKTKPAAIVRQVKVRGEAYGRSNGTMLISTIRLVNHIVSTITLITEKMGSPALGMFSNSLEGQDGVVDASPRTLTVFRETAARTGGRPIFPLAETGDPSALVNFLLPYLNDKVTTAFKIDTLLDFNSAKEMTATESLQRFVIRGKSLTGMLTQQKVEGLDVILPRCLQILDDLGEISDGVPDVVKEVADEGRPWFELEYTNEMEKLTRTESVENMLQFLNTLLVSAEADPNLLQAVDWYKMIDDIRMNIDSTIDILKTKDEYDAVVEQQKQLAAMQAQVQAGLAGAEMDKKTAEATKARKL
jgi:hypothetical protein